MITDNRIERWKAAYRVENKTEPPTVEYNGRGWWWMDGRTKLFRAATFEQWAITLESRQSAAPEQSSKEKP